MVERMNPEVKAKPTFRGVRKTAVVRAHITGGLPAPCDWEAGDRKFTPTTVEVRFGDGITSVYVSGPRVPQSCDCNCHPKRDMEDADYGVTYYPSNPGKRPPAWIWEWAQRAMGGAA